MHVQFIFESKTNIVTLLFSNLTPVGYLVFNLVLPFFFLNILLG